MILKKTVSLIIPCYNEGKRILPVYSVIKTCDFIDEVIIVDDGSDILTKNVLKDLVGVKVITHPKNKGKSAALKTGINASSGEILVFVDSDLLNLTAIHLKNLITPVASGEYDLTLSDREFESLHTRVSGFSVAFTGERAIKRSLLLKNIDIFDACGYLIESAMNRRFFGKVKIARVFFDGVKQRSKYEKIGAKGFFKGDIDMFWHITHYLGIGQLLYQLYFGLTVPKTN